jgi:RecA-family ATPase
MIKPIKLNILVKNAADSVQMLLEKFLPKVGLAALIGESDIGKSTWLILLALFVALKEKLFLGMKLNVTHGRALYVSTEDDASNFGPRAKKLCKKLEISESELEKIEFYFTDDVEKLASNLNDYLSDNKFDLVVIDAFSDILSEDGNNATVVRKTLNGLSKIASRYQCLILVLHHMRKSAGSEPSKNDVLGSSGFEAKMRSVIGLYRGNEPGEVKMKILKGNYLSPEDKMVVRTLSFVDQYFTLKVASIQPFEKDSIDSIKLKGDKILQELKDLDDDTKNKTQLFQLALEKGYPYKKTKFYSDYADFKTKPSQYGI